ncbi:MAG TPA: hypothetical protein VG939_01770 [Caulobacteraceae bacterium]|nr:hypothetical protein [Caulobacteraceae bacterium]
MIHKPQPVGWVWVAQLLAEAIHDRRTQTAKAETPCGRWYPAGPTICPDDLHNLAAPR